MRKIIPPIFAPAIVVLVVFLFVLLVDRASASGFAIDSSSYIAPADPVVIEQSIPSQNGNEPTFCFFDKDTLAFVDSFSTEDGEIPPYTFSVYTGTTLPVGIYRVTEMLNPSNCSGDDSDTVLSNPSFLNYQDFTVSEETASGLVSAEGMGDAIDSMNASVEENINVIVVHYWPFAAGAGVLATLWAVGRHALTGFQ